MAGVPFSRVELVAGTKDKTFGSGVRVFDIEKVVDFASVYARDTCLSPTR